MEYLSIVLTKCQWCGREGVPVTKKGGLKPHVDLTGRPCLLAGVRVERSNWGRHKVKPITNKRPGRSRSGGAAKR